MTRSEAIKILWQYDVNFEPHPAEDVMHAIDMAIEALQREQQRREDIYECQYCFGEVHKNYIYCPFCGMRIEVVEKEETLQNLTKPNKSDLISRQAAIDEAKEWIDAVYFEENDKRERKAIECFIGSLKNMPSAQPFTAEQIQTMQELESAQIEKAYELGKADRPTGHWIETAQEYYEMINEKGGGVDENTPYFTDDIACSECLAKFSVIDNETERFDFCPNCGSYNGGGEE